MPHLVYIVLGSNMGNSKENLANACHKIGQHIGQITRFSSLYQTAAWGNTEQNEFINQVILVQTELSAQETLTALLGIEKEMGRTRNKKWEPRIIDLDILFYDTLQVNEPNLIIPHPHLQDRRFTLIPLVEIAPSFVHPALIKTMAELLATCTDLLEVEKLGEN
ncbi:MAG: 2-amino-4-hydroxy-6-hydroxymethyldihydropteridine diphosphokinase [Bacteroidetes bacterium B1(2017)]|nr:MAG: 2-amino-4-hydroxy-6-hydroxymethyldihydropteridine diphosphokinase [Bacteroidetes bacterium B1(2017)]